MSVRGAPWQILNGSLLRSNESKRMFSGGVGAKLEGTGTQATALRIVTQVKVIFGRRDQCKALPDTTGNAICFGVRNAE